MSSFGSKIASNAAAGGFHWSFDRSERDESTGSCAVAASVAALCGCLWQNVVLRVRPLISKEQEEAAARSLFVQHVFVVGSPMVAHCLDGFNCSMFAFGQTGSGKTYTMWGSIPKSGSLSDEAGIAPRFFKALFLRIEQPAGSAISMQIYNEQIRDLVEPATKNLQISGSGPPGALAE
ncbi:hypothetical protein SELMODRAFT_404857 [Selaginella moellendorffii]|uniref:Kinesin motor domain-containing protein n=1 Tax=Selaginella moellendorffii TaxID=88036 RepID=D8QXK7_SELML|nr:hypothetical protein SELMODRAFT_404857 [Selaginella moellendorffii]